MKRYFLPMAFVLLYTASAYASYVGLTYSQVMDEVSAGILGEYDNKENIKLTGSLNIGDIYRGKARLEYLLDVYDTDIKLFTDITAKGYDIDALGRDQTYGIALRINKFDVGVGGQSASPWHPPHAYDELVSEGYDEGELEGRGLESIYPAPKGIPFQSGNFLNVYAMTDFNLKGAAVDLKGIFNIYGSGDKAQQVHGSIKMSQPISLYAKLTLTFEHAVMLYQEELHSESAVIASYDYNF